MQVHDFWQVDAKEQLQLASKQKACYLTRVDETSGCLLQAFVFPPLPYQSTTNIAYLKADTFTKEHLTSLSVSQNQYIKCCNFVSPPNS
jgi:hypothetical protein